MRVDIVITIVLIIVIVYLMMKFTSRKSAQKDSSNQQPVKPRRKAKYGKWIGGGLGWAFGGPIGAMLGFMFGSMYDGMQSGDYEYRRTQTGDFSVSLLILAAAVMKADGRVVKSELNYVRIFLERQFGRNEAEQKILMLREILKQEIRLQEVCMQIRQYMEYASRLQLIHFLFGVSSADGNYHPKEVDVIEAIANYLSVSKIDFSSIKAMFVKDPSSCYKILEVSADASDDEVRKAYHKMAIKYHPDKVAHLGGDIQKAAKEKFQKLNGAYAEIKKQRGIK